MITHPKKLAFLKHYPELGQVRLTCSSVGVSKSLYYEWVKDDKQFSDAMDTIKKEIEGDRLEQLEAELHSRAMGGTSKQSDILLMFELKAEKPDKYREKVADTKLIGDITIKLAIPAYDDKLRLTEVIEAKEVTDGQDSQREDEALP